MDLAGTFLMLYVETGFSFLLMNAEEVRFYRYKQVSVIIKRFSVRTFF